MGTLFYYPTIHPTDENGHCEDRQRRSNPTGVNVLFVVSLFLASFENNLFNLILS